MSFRRLALAGCWAAAAAAAAASPAALYKGAIVTDAATGRVLFENGADEVSPPASMTKLMTFAVLEDRIRAGALGLRTPVTVTAADARVAMQRDSTSVWLKGGEVFPVEELVYAMLIRSANDAAYALAQAAGGSVENFVALMNGKAAALGMTRTRFRTPNGFPVRSHRIADGDLTTPRDFARLCRYLLLNTDVTKYTSVRTRLFGIGRRPVPVAMTNFNHLLGKVAGVDGLKSGFTDGAGFCLSSTALRNGRRVIVVVMGSPDWRSLDFESRQLIERGFATPPSGRELFPNPTARPAPPASPPPAHPDSPIEITVP